MKKFLLILSLFIFSNSYSQVYTTGAANWPQVWDSNSGYFDVSDGVGLYSFGDNVAQGQLNGRFITSDGTVNGNTTTLNPGQKLIIKMTGQNGDGRSGIQTNGMIGFSLRTTNDLYDGGGDMNSRYSGNSVLRVEFLGGESSAKFWTGSGISTSGMPNFTTFKAGVIYEVEVISDKEFNLIVGGTRHNIHLFNNGGGTIRQIQVRNSGANMDAVFTNLEVANIPIHLYSTDAKVITGIIANNGATANTVTKEGSGTVTLTGVNTYTGLTTISAGTLQLNKIGGATIPATNTITIASGATLRVSSNQTLNNLIIQSGASLIIDNGVSLTINGTFDYDGTISNNGTIAYGTNATLSYNKSATTGSEWPAVNYPANVIIKNSVTTDGSKILSGNLTINNGSILTANNLISRSALGGIFLNQGTIIVGYDSSFPSNFSNFDFTSGSAKFLGGSIPIAIPSLNGATYNYLEINGPSHHVTTDVNVNTLRNLYPLYVDSGSNLFVKNSVENYDTGKVVLANNANLLQDSDGTINANVGNITVNRNVSLRRLDYVFWGSPVAGQELQAFSENTLPERFYTLNETSNSFAAVANVEDNFEPAKGYMIRAPNTFTTSLQNFPGSFTGIPNNGNVDITITHSGLGFNLLSNPYPSPIDADLFLDANPGTLYFWTHQNQDPDSSNYVTYNDLGVANPESGDFSPNGTIQNGQGFILHTASSGTAVFRNSMRVGNNDNQFFRNTPVEKHRFWLSVSKEGKKLNQALIGYMEGATQGIDPAVDGLQNYGGSSISSSINAVPYVIQGRALPFDNSDEVPLIFKAVIQGNYTISLDQFDGLFMNQEIYLKDSLTGIVHDIKNGDYTFASEAGNFAERFSIIFQTTLGLEIPVLDADTIIVFKQNGTLNINSGKMIMKEIRLFDIRGRLLFSKDGIFSNTVSLNDLNTDSQVLVLQVKSNDGKTFIKKMIY